MEMVRTAHAVLGSIAAIPKLFVAQIAGHALGGGLEIALACDLRFGAQGEYKLGAPGGDAWAAARERGHSAPAAADRR